MDDHAPTYFVGVKHRDGVLISTVVTLEDVDEAFEKLAKFYRYSSGVFYLYRRRYIGFAGEINRVQDSSCNQKIPPDYLARRQPFYVSTPIQKPKHPYELWTVDPDSCTQVSLIGYDNLEDMEQALKQSTDSFYLGLQVLTGIWWHHKM